MANLKRNFSVGFGLIFLPVLAFFLAIQFLNCRDEYVFLPDLLFGVQFALDQLTEFSWFFIGIGLVIISYSIWIRERQKGISKKLVSAELFFLLLFVLCIFSVFLASLNTAREKGLVAYTKATLSQTRALGEVYFDEHRGTYAGFCTTPEAQSSYANLYKRSSEVSGQKGTLCAVPHQEISCLDNGSAYAVSAKLLTPGRDNGKYWCVDSTGFSGLIEESVTDTKCQE